MLSKIMSVGVGGIKVHLIDYPKEPLRTISTMLKATWTKTYAPEETDYEMIKAALKGKALGNALESVQMTFAVEGVSRSFTHQFVRQRIGFGFMQQGGRDVDWSEHRFTIPESINDDPEMQSRYTLAIIGARDLYNRMLARGIPYQDARFIMPIGTSTYITATMNFRALQSFIARRLCNGMQWEINYVARLMVAEVRKFLPELGDELKCQCEIRKKCVVLEKSTFPPCGFMPADPQTMKWEYPFSNDVNGNKVFIARDKALGRKWIPGIDKEE